MSPGELRQLAACRDAAAATITRDSARLRTCADELDGVLMPLVPMSQRVWVGPAADNFEAEVRAHTARLDAEAHRLRAVASSLDRKADAARREADEFRRRALSAETAAVAGLS